MWVLERLTGARLRCNENTDDPPGATDLFELMVKMFLLTDVCTSQRGVSPEPK